MATWDNLADLVNIAARSTFGESATIGTETITAVFGNESQDVTPPGKPKVIARSPVLDYRTDDLVTQPVAGASVTVSGTSYTVREVRPDGQGWTRLRLQVA